MRALLLFTALLFVNYSFGLNPSRTYKQLPSKFNMKYEEHKVKTNDGLATLNAWSFKATTGETTKLVLIAHNGEGNMADYLRRVDVFTHMGYNVVIFDYRGYGESSEFEIDNNMYIYPHFQDDYTSMIDFCRKKFTPKFSVYGWGIGGGLSLGIGWNRSEVNKIIADTPFLSMEDLETRFEDWDEPMEVPFAGYEKKNEPIFSLDNEPNGDKEVLLIVGSNDILFKSDDYEKLKKKQKKVVKEIVVIENPDRKDNLKADKTTYRSKIKEFLN